MEIIELILNDSPNAGMDTISLVENPASQQTFMCFSDEINSTDIEQFILEEILKSQLEPKYEFSQINEKQMLMGPLMVANKLMLRKNKSTGQLYYVYMSEETIEKVTHKMMKDGLTKKINIEHNPNHFVDNIHLVEIWIVEDPSMDKSLLYGFKPNKGDCYAIYKIDNTEIWTQYIKTGRVNGFSPELYMIENN